MDLTWEGVEKFIGGTVVDPGTSSIEEFLSDPVVKRMIQVMVQSLCRKGGIDFRVHGEDFVSEVNEVIFPVLTTHEWADRARRLTDFPRGIYQLSRNRIDKITESPEWLGTSGMSTAVRRRRAIAVYHRKLVAQMGREPSSRELIESYNAEMTRSRKDAARQGMIASEMDLQPLATLSLDAPAVETLGYEDVDPLMSSGSTPLAEEIIRRATIEDELLGAVARSWLGKHSDEVFLSVKGIAKNLHMDPADVVEAQQAIQAITVTVLRELGMPE